MSLLPTLPTTQVDGHLLFVGRLASTMVIDFHTVCSSCRCCFVHCVSRSRSLKLPFRALLHASQSLPLIALWYQPLIRQRRSERETASSSDGAEDLAWHQNIPHMKSFANQDLDLCLIWIYLYRKLDLVMLCKQDKATPYDRRLEIVEGLLQACHACFALHFPHGVRLALSLTQLADTVARF